ncbi:MAG: hypothetical protein V2B14_05630 [bacterium]
MKIFKNFFKGSHKGFSLVIVFFLSAIALLITVTMLNVAGKNADQITDNKFGKQSYYAAEAGLAKVNQAFNSGLIDFGYSLEESNLPTEGTPEELSNGALYWVDSIDYIDSGTVAVVDIIGKYKNSSRKIRARVVSSIPGEYDNYGLLTDGLLTIHGNKTLKMSIHGNDGLTLTGPNNMENNSVATQSSDSGAASPDAVSNPVGGYVPEIDVPEVPISEYKAKARAGINLDINQPDLITQIMNAPAESIIYVAGNLAYSPDKTLMFANYNKPSNRVIFIPVYNYKDTNIRLVKHTTTTTTTTTTVTTTVTGTTTTTTTTTYSGNNTTIELCGDMQGKVIFVDGDVIINANGISDLSNVMIISSGTLTVNGSVDIGTSHSGKTDVIFACENDITLNGSRDFSALFWTNGSFRQNGSSTAGRVIAQDGITFNGNFTLEGSDELYDNGMIDKVYTVASWQQVTLDEEEE